MASPKSRLEHSVTAIALRSYLAEFISTFFFIFAAVTATMSSRKMMLDAASDSSTLVAIVVANMFALSVAVYISVNISGGHVSPAVTFGMAVGGHISIPMAIFYSISQMFGSFMACLLLKATTVGQHVPTHAIEHEMTSFGGAVLEGVMTFALAYTVYVAANLRPVSVGAIGPLAIGLIAGANVIASGPFTRGSMNPAYAFSSAIVGGSFKNQAVDWVGLLIGAAITGILHDNVVFPVLVPDSFRGNADGVGV